MKEWLEQLCPEIEEWQADLICEQVANEVAAERETNAGICDRFHERQMTPAECAAAIRARGEK